MKKKKAISCILACALLVSGMGNTCVFGEEVAVWDDLEGEVIAEEPEDGTATGGEEPVGQTQGDVSVENQDDFQNWTESYYEENQDDFQNWTETYYEENGGADNVSEDAGETSHRSEEHREFWDDRDAAYEKRKEQQGTISKNSEDVYTVEDFAIPDAEDAKTDFDLMETSELPTQLYLQVPEILQRPELPTGCESVALTMALQYENFDVDKLTIAGDFLIYNYETDNMAIGYVGDPFSEEGAGCFAPAIAATAFAFFTDQEVSYKAYDITDTDFEELFAYIAAGTPVILWTTMYMAEPEFTRMDVEYNGRVYRWYRQEHCVVLSGYNLEERTVQINDPLEGIVSRDMDEFASIYNLTGKNAVVLKEAEEAAASQDTATSTEVGLP
ncbi:C39 family peptidase [Marvinbryantia sp.]|uniref:C39 family peptidase n=1 Tax=Marvinbryantia sp. TaxID=2496532 RepID=UPI0025D17932|nr:C39 family peptidase [uncultured Marvinbryantia sp.]